MFAFLDDKLRNYISYIYRFILAWYAIFIAISQKDENYFQLVYYFIFATTYYLLFILCKKKSKRAIFRLILDYAFITLVLYQKQLELHVNYLLVLLPLFNSPNFSGNKKDYSVYFVAIFSILILSWENKRLYYFIPFLPLFLINSTFRIRESVRRLNDTLFNIVDEFYAQNIGKKESSKIYNSILSIFAKSSFTRTLEIDRIICFIERKGELALVNSNVFIVKVALNHQKDILDRLAKRPFDLGQPVNIDGVDYKSSMFLKVTGNNRDYIFLLPFRGKKLLQNFQLLLIGNFLLVPFFKHLARVFETQFQINQQRRKNLNSLKENKDYILKANEAMHFVKNSLSPIKSALRISEMYFSAEDEETKEYLKEIFIKQRKQSLLEIQNITQRSDFILKKSKNPFESTNILNVSVSNLINTLRRDWSETYLSSNITFDIDKNLNVSELVCNIDIDTFYLIIHNIMSNLTKYGNNRDSHLIFEIKQNSLIICFKNNILLEKAGFDQLKKDIDNYNKDLRIEIYKRKSHGFAHLKQYIESIGADSFIEIKENFYIFKLKIPTL